MNRDLLKMLALAAYAGLFALFTFFTGNALRRRGWMFLRNTLEHREGVAESVQFLLSLGFYLMCLSLLLWNLGTEPSDTYSGTGSVFVFKDMIQTVALRLGISIFVVSVFHTLNVLTLALLNKKYEPPK